MGGVQSLLLQTFRAIGGSSEHCGAPLNSSRPQPDFEEQNVPRVRYQSCRPLSNHWQHYVQCNFAALWIGSRTVLYAIGIAIVGNRATEEIEFVRRARKEVLRRSANGALHGSHYAGHVGFPRIYLQMLLQLWDACLGSCCSAPVNCWKKETSPCGTPATSCHIRIDHFCLGTTLAQAPDFVDVWLQNPAANAAILASYNLSPANLCPRQDNELSHKTRQLTTARRLDLAAQLINVCLHTIGLQEARRSGSTKVVDGCRLTLGPRNQGSQDLGFDPSPFPRQYAKDISKRARLTPHNVLKKRRMQNQPLMVGLTTLSNHGVSRHPRGPQLHGAHGGVMTLHLKPVGHIGNNHKFEHN